MNQRSCRFVQIADVHYVVPTHARVGWPELVEKLPEQVRACELIDSMLPAALEQIYTEIRPDFVVYTGDQVNAGWDEEGLANQHGWQQLLAECGSDAVPNYHVFGNHDRPRERFIEIYGESIYSFECNGRHFAVLDSGVMGPEEGAIDLTVADRGIDELAGMLAAADGAPAAVLLHFYMIPTGIEGYSFRRAEEAIRILAGYDRIVPVFNGHAHGGRAEVVGGAPYLTARSFIEAPFAFHLHELTEDVLRTDEYVLDPKRGKWSGYTNGVYDIGLRG